MIFKMVRQSETDNYTPIVPTEYSRRPLTSSDLVLRLVKIDQVYFSVVSLCFYRFTVVCLIIRRYFSTRETDGRG